MNDARGKSKTSQLSTNISSSDGRTMDQYERGLLAADVGVVGVSPKVSTWRDGRPLVTVHCELTLEAPASAW